MLNSYDIQRIENAIWVLSEYQGALTEYPLENAADNALEIYHSIYNLMKMSDGIFNTNFLKKRSVIYMKPKEFAKMVYDMADKDCGVCPPPTEAQTGLNVLISHFLGDDWCTSLPLGTEQVNTEAVLAILERFPNPEQYNRT